MHLAWLPSKQAHIHLAWLPSKQAHIRVTRAARAWQSQCAHSAQDRTMAMLLRLCYGSLKRQRLPWLQLWLQLRDMTQTSSVSAQARTMAM